LISEPTPPAQLRGPDPRQPPDSPDSGAALISEPARAPASAIREELEVAATGAAFHPNRVTMIKIW